nr:MAG: hypothetical protein [Porcellio scaber clopovirus]
MIRNEELAKKMKAYILQSNIFYKRKSLILESVLTDKSGLTNYLYTLKRANAIREKNKDFPFTLKTISAYSTLTLKYEERILSISILPTNLFKEHYDIFLEAFSREGWAKTEQVIQRENENIKNNFHNLLCIFFNISELERVLDNLPEDSEIIDVVN